MENLVMALQDENQMLKVKINNLNADALHNARIIIRMAFTLFDSGVWTSDYASSCCGLDEEEFKTWYGFWVVDSSALDEWTFEDSRNFMSDEIVA